MTDLNILIGCECPAQLGSECALPNAALPTEYQYLMLYIRHAFFDKRQVEVGCLGCPRGADILICAASACICFSSEFRLGALRIDVGRDTQVEGRRLTGQCSGALSGIFCGFETDVRLCVGIGVGDCTAIISKRREIDPNCVYDVAC
jgi:hypothetical protein